MPVMTLLWMKVVDCFLFSYLQLEMLVIHGSEQYLTLCASHSMPFFFQIFPQRLCNCKGIIVLSGNFSIELLVAKCLRKVGTKK